MTAASPRLVDVILNHASGKADKDPIAAKIPEVLHARGMQVRVYVARSTAELLNSADRAAAGDAAIVAAGGGDGTVAAVAQRLVNTDKALAVLPLGTFNYFARRFDVPLDVDGALDVITAGVSSRIDVGEVNGRIFLNSASIGLYSAVLERRETTFRALGRSRVVAYAVVARSLIEPPALLNLRIEADGVPLARRTPLLFVGVNEYQMETFGIPGAGCLRTGRLASYITRPLGVFQMWRLALRAFFRGLHGANAFEVVCSRELRVTMRRRRVRVAVDGEVLVLDTPLQFRLRPGALTVLAGPPSTKNTAA
ncbi:MAG TPA: diacylglycerol kinase family protein [Vicinamibacterales bacterium]|nr:diacylglycerol kinase family protein [Vicinamibacterales bacterium]